MNIEGVVIFDTKSGVPLYSKLKDDIDSSLFSSFVTAIGHFSKELKFGGLSSFTTEEKMIFLAARESTITALITPKREEFQQAYSLANELGRQFEERLGNVGTLQPADYKEFNIIADDFLRKIRDPYTSRVASFVHIKYGGEISTKPRLMKESGTEGSLDMMITHSTKYDEDDDSRGKRSVAESLSHSYIFCKISEGRMSKGEIMEFIDTIDGFGARVMNKGNLDFIPYFPSRAVIVAREFNQQAIDYLKRLPKDNGSSYIDGNHVFMGRGIKNAPKDMKCYLDLYQWHDDQEPEPVKI